VSQPFHGTIVQIQMAHPQAAPKSIRVYGISVVLRRYMYVSGIDITDWMIPSAVPEFELEGVGSESTPD